MQNGIVWQDDFVLGVQQMDNTHQEFVALLAAVQQADDTHLLQHWQALIAHTEVHFDTENQWMRATHFAASNCHTTHHKAVLDVMKEGLAYGQKGHLGIVRQMAAELGNWFPQHADTMDAALAMHLQRIGFDPATGQIARPHLLPQELIHGCGGDTCSDATQQELSTEVPA